MKRFERMIVVSRTFVIAIAGGTCSGKSTLAKLIGDTFSSKVPTRVMNMDAYFKKNPPDTIAPITRRQYVEHNHPDSLELERLYDDFHTFTESGEYRLVIIEGLFALYLDPLRERADLKIFVDLASDERLVRRITKHMQWGQTYEQVTDRFIDTVRFRHNELIEPTRWHADIVVGGVIDRTKAPEILTAYLDRQFSTGE